MKAFLSLSFGRLRIKTLSEVEGSLLKEGGVQMRIILILFAVTLIFISAANCEQQYNPNENRWETVPDGSNWTTQYNPHDSSWSYQPQDAQIEYNPHESTWDWDSGHNPGRD